MFKGFETVLVVFWALKYLGPDGGWGEMANLVKIDEKIPNLCVWA